MGCPPPRGREEWPVPQEGAAGRLWSPEGGQRQGWGSTAEMRTWRGGPPIAPSPTVSSREPPALPLFPRWTFSANECLWLLTGISRGWDVNSPARGFMYFQ